MDDMLPNEKYDGDIRRRESRHHNLAKYRDHSYFNADKTNRHAIHYNHDGYPPPGEVAMKRSRQLSSNTDLTKLPTQYLMQGGPQNLYKPSYFDPHNLPNVFSQVHVGGKPGNIFSHSHNKIEGRERDATLLHHLGRMSPEEQLNKFLKSVEREQELRQMKGISNEDLSEEKSPRERRRRRQLLRRMTDGLHSKREPSEDKMKNNPNDDGNQYAVIDKKKISNTQIDPRTKKGSEPVRWMSLNGINHPSGRNEQNDRVNGKKNNRDKSVEAKDMSTDKIMEDQSRYQSNRVQNDMDKRASIAFRNRYRERTDVPKNFASMSQLDGLFKGRRISDSESGENDEQGVPFFLSRGEKLANKTYLDDTYQGAQKREENHGSRENFHTHNKRLSSTNSNAHSMASSMNSEPGMMENTSMANHLHSSKDGKSTISERKKLSLSMLKAKFSHKGKSSDIFQSDQSSSSHSPNSMNFRDNFLSNRNNSISPTDKMSTGSDDAMKSGISTNDSNKDNPRYSTLIPRQGENIDGEAKDDEFEDDHYNNDMDGTEFSCSCTDVTLDDKYKITHRHHPTISSLNYNNREELDNTGRNEKSRNISNLEKENEEDMIPRNVDTIENVVYQTDKRQMIESEEQTNGSRSLDNITAGYSTRKTNFDEQQAFLSLNDSTTATKVRSQKFCS